MKLPCGCCSGIEIITPEREASPPGLTAISYRVGTYATFFESMLARLSSIYLDVPAVDSSGSTTRLYPLKRLTTRDTADPSIALMDAWAVVADVLSFYEERIANEGYLPTAVERRSILELAGLIGYTLRPGVSASVYLAFTIANGFQGVLPAGTRAQSVPAAGQTAQYFETSTDLTARDTWNNLKPRLTRPQVITLNVDPGTDSLTRETIYLDGIATNLKQNDALLFVLNDDPNADPVQQQLRIVDSVGPNGDQKWTEVTLQESLPDPGTSVEDALSPFVDEADSIFSGSDIAAAVKALLEPFLPGATDPVPAGTVAVSLVQLIPEIQSKHDVAVKRKFTRLEPWLSHLLDVLDSLVLQLTNQLATEPRNFRPIPPAANLAKASALQRLVGILDKVAAAPSVQPANPKRLPRSVAQAFASQTDIAPRLLAAFRPSAASTIYRAWSGSETPSSKVEVMAMRVKTGLFPGSYPGHASSALYELPGAPQNTVAQFVGPSINNSWNDCSQSTTSLDVVALDGAFDKILPGSWVAIERPDVDTKQVLSTRTTTFHRVVSVRTSTLNTQGIEVTQGTVSTVVKAGGPGGFSAKSTQLTLDPPWLSSLVPKIQPRILIKTALDIARETPQFLHQTVVYAQSELLDLSEEPLDTDVEGDTIELDDVYTGLESGRWIFVSGERTDIPDTSGVTGNELVMIAAVNQGTNAPESATSFPDGLVPFFSGVYTTDANRYGDKLVVGLLTPQGMAARLNLPRADTPNQVYRDQVQLAPGLYANAYVPTAAERAGSFPDFAGILVDPDTGAPYPGGTIDSTRFSQGIFAWRISTQPVHTILTLANKLAYTYDTPTVSINANVVLATHGQTTGEILGDGDATQAFDTFALHQSPITYVSAATPDGVESTLVVRVNDIQWHEQPDFVDLGPRDRGFTTQTDDSDQTSVIFGNGEHGTRVPTGTANIKATYRYGIGSSGNVAAQQISQLATHPLGAQGVINPLAATGGADRDSLDQARRNAPVAVMALDRLISTDDYAEFSRTYAGIGKASAARLSDGRRQIVHVTVAGAGDIPIAKNSDLYRNLVQSLLQFGDPYLPLQVCLRKVKLLVIAAGVQILPDFAWESVVPQIRAALLDKFSFDSRALGQSAFLSEAIAIMQAIPGVSYADVQTFDAVAEDVTAGQLAGLASTLTRNNHVQAQLARLNLSFDPSTDADPCRRVLPAELVFLTPDIADTLILNQIGGS